MTRALSLIAIVVSLLAMAVSLAAFRQSHDKAFVNSTMCEAFAGPGGYLGHDQNGTPQCYPASPKP